MAATVHVSKWQQWTNGDYGDGKPEKYRFGIEADVTLVSQDKASQTATFEMKGTMYTRCSPNGINTGPAADFAWLTIGSLQPSAECPWTEPNKNYYGQPLPFYPSNQSAAMGRTLAIFRGDTQRSTAPYNRTTLWSCNGGIVENNRTTDGQQNYSFTFTWTQSVANGGNTVVLWLTTSGCAYNGSTGYNTNYTYVNEWQWLLFSEFPPEVEHCVYYDANGGRDAPEPYCWTSAEDCDYVTLSSQKPWSPHWVFLGWSENPKATSPTYQPGQTILVCDPIYLYAVYRYTYRPGMHMMSGSWYSHDRDGASGPEGYCNVLHGGTWYEMRIDPIHSGLEDPPCIERGSWQIQKLIGIRGEPHHIQWDCPHQWRH